MPGTVYKRLREHLDGLPVGFPRTDSGVEIDILKKIFDLEEAEMATRLQILPETLKDFCRRTGIEAQKAESMLEKMADKGQIFRIRQQGRTLYCAACFIPGIWEYQLEKLDPDLASMVEKFYGEAMGEAITDGTPPIFRVLPVDEHLTMEMEVMPYDQVREIIRSQKTIALAKCICRKERRLSGRDCNHIDEVCLLFSHMARYYVDNGLARFISVDEGVDVLDRAEEDGLVHSPQNAQRPMGFCNCCGCCCGILRGITQLGLPTSKVVRSDYYCLSDPESCSGCGECAERCHVHAIALVEEIATVDHSRCIGCGLCVSTCPTGSLGLRRKDPGQISTLPASVGEVFRQRAAERARSKRG